jgi:hypothetical protein
MKMTFRIATLVRTVLVDAIPVVDGADLRFRLEIFSWSPTEYTCQLWRLDTYRVPPSFVPMVADEEILVIDTGFGLDAMRAATADEMLSKALGAIERQLGVTIERR